MELNILVVLNGRIKEGALLRKLTREKASRYCLCPTDRQAESSCPRLKERLSSSLNAEVEVIDFVGIFNQNAFRFKERYSDFIYRASEKQFYSGQGLKNYFKYPKENFSLWWLSLVYEKNPYKSNSFGLFVQAITILELKDKSSCGKLYFNNVNHPILKVFRDSGLSHVFCTERKSRILSLPEEIRVILIETLRAAKFIGTLLIKIIDAKLLKSGFKKYKNKLESASFVFITMFPYLDEPRLKEGKFVNLAYGLLQNGLEKEIGDQMAWVGMYAPLKSYTWKKAVRAAKKVKGIDRFFLLEEWLGFGDLLNIATIYLKISLRCLTRLGRYGDIFTEGQSQGTPKLKLWAIVKKDFLSSFMGKSLISEITHHILFSNMSKDLAKKAKVVYFAEMHAWERALLFACSKREDISCIGLQHTIVPLLLLNYFHHKEELKGGDFIKNPPLPGHLGCVGQLCRDIFLKDNWPPEKLFVLGGFRFFNFEDKSQAYSKIKHKKNQIVVVFSISPQENKEMLFLLKDAFKDKNIDFKIFLKSHPASSAKNLVKKINLDLSSEVFEFTDEPLEALIYESRAVIVKESSSVLWALYNGIPVIVPLLYETIDLSPLSGLSNLATYCKGPEQLFLATLDLVNGEEKTSNFEYGRDFLRRYVNSYAQDNAYSENLLSAIKQ